MIPLLLSVTAVANPPDVEPGAVHGPVWVERLRQPVSSGFDPDLYDALLEQAAARAPVGVREVQLQAVDLDGRVRDLRELLPPSPPQVDKGEPYRAAPADHPGASSGFLSDRAVYLSQCHGWIWFSTLGRFATQRGNNHATVEDFHNPEGANQYLSAYLENAGAAVFTARERDQNPLMAIADNDGSGYTETGSGFADGAAGFADTSPYAYGENPFQSGTTRTFPADGGGVASWQPVVPEDGHYVVYVSWDSSPAHASDAHYRITHPGGVIDRWYDQKVHGSTWQYVEKLWLTAGTSLKVELIGDASEAGARLSADAVRIGGGVADVQRQGTTSARPRWEDGAIQYIQFNGAPPSVYDPFGDGTSGDGGSDPASRSYWADWEHPPGEDAVFVSWHSNAFDGTARGTVTYYGGGCATAGSYDLGLSVQDELMGMIETWWEPNWIDRGVASSCFSEVDGAYNDEMPAILVELAFHDNAVDADYLTHPVFRDDASRAMYRGIVRYFAERDGVTPRYLPEPPVGLSMVNDGGELVASWSPGPSGAPYGDPVDSWLLFTSTDGRAWDAGTPVSGTSAVVPASVGQAVYVRVAAVNAGGVSFPSAVVGAVRSGYGTPPVLIVDAFDRLDRGLLDVENVPTLGDIVRLNVHRTNPGDIVATHGRAIAGAGFAFDSVSDEALDALDLASYVAVVWATGEESTVDQTFDDDQQASLRAHVEAGGALWASGAEILWDLDLQGDADDQRFAEEVLGATLLADDAGTTDVDGEGILAGMVLDFGVEDGAPYPVEYPDALSSTRPVIARYGSGDVAAVLGDGVALFGFPFEAIGDEDVRVQVAGAVLDALLEGWTPPAPTTPGTGTGTTGTTGTTGAGTGPDGYSREALEPRRCGCGTGSSAPGLALALVALFARRSR